MGKNGLEFGEDVRKDEREACEGVSEGGGCGGWGEGRRV